MFSRAFSGRYSVCFYILKLLPIVLNNNKLAQATFYYLNYLIVCILKEITNTDFQDSTNRVSYICNYASQIPILDFF